MRLQAWDDDDEEDEQDIHYVSFFFPWVMILSSYFLQKTGGGLFHGHWLPSYNIVQYTVESFKNVVLNLYQSLELEHVPTYKPN